VAAPRAAALKTLNRQDAKTPRPLSISRALAGGSRLSVLAMGPGLRRDGWPSLDEDAK